MKAAAQAPASSGKSDDKIELVCSSGHRTIHSLARVARLNDGWCGTCGADISYSPSDAAEAAPAKKRAEGGRGHRLHSVSEPSES